MTGPKLNEGALLLDDRVATKATARYLRGSASKARVVLDLIRGLDVRRADEVLQFTTRDAAVDVRKVLASAVANAIHNDSQDADELFVIACYADEGPTLRRFRPRARGRATRIRKRTCHITVIVARLSDARLEVLQNRQQAQPSSGRRRPSGTAQSRRDRVERSRTRAQSLREGGETTETDTSGDAVDAVDTNEVMGDEVPQGGVEAPADGSIPDGFEIKGNADSMKYHVPGGRYYDATIAEVFFDTTEHAEAAGYEAPVADEAVVEELAEEEAAAAADQPSDAEVQGLVATDLPEGGVEAPEDGSIPEGHPIKGNANSMLYHQPGGRYYEVTIAEVFFDTPEHAEAAGYSAPATEEST